MAGGAFHDPPTVILSTGAGGGLEIDLFTGVLADVGDVEITGQAVEGEAPGLTQAQGPDLGRRLALAAERVVSRNAVVGRGRNVLIHIDAQHFALETITGLGVAVGVGLGSAIAVANVEIAVGSELNLTPAMDGGGLSDGDQDHATGRIRNVGVLRHRVAGDHGSVGGVGVVDEEEAVGVVVRVEGDAFDAAFESAAHQAADVEEGRQRKAAVVDQDLTVLGGNKQTAVPGIDDAHRVADGRDRRQLKARGTQSVGWAVGQRCRA
ncbi:hypothetical protein AC249_AIPGENE5364, partial [Exaiptasia diaphana]